MQLPTRRLSVRAQAQSARPVVHAANVQHPRSAVDHVRTRYIPRLLDHQIHIQQLEKRLGALAQCLDGQLAVLKDVLDECQPMEMYSNSLQAPTRRGKQGHMLLPPIGDISLDELALEMAATNEMWAEAQHQHQAILDAATSTLVSSQAKAPVYATYRQRLLELAQEAEASEVAARSQRAAMRAEQRRQQRAAAAGRKAARTRARAQPPAADFVPPAPPAPTTTKLNVAVKCQTQPGQDVLLVGCCPALGSWDVGSALPMTWTEGHVWRASLELEEAPGAPLEYKALVRQPDGSVMWERGDNHVAAFGESCELDAVHVFAA